MFVVEQLELLVVETLLTFLQEHVAVVFLLRPLTYLRIELVLLSEHQLEGSS